MTQNTRCDTNLTAAALQRRDAVALRILHNELTPRQRQVMTDYYMGDQNAAALARRYGVAPSTVWRTLRRAEARFYRFLQYHDDVQSTRQG